MNEKEREAMASKDHAGQSHEYTLQCGKCVTELAASLYQVVK